MTSAARAQKVANDIPDSVRRNAAALPFGPGERAQYRVSYGRVGRVGTGTMEVAGIELVDGAPTYHLDFRLSGRVVFLGRVDDHAESWLDVRGIFSRRYREKKHEINFDRVRERNFSPEKRRWTGHTNDRQESGVLTTAEPLDDTAFLYFVRTIPLVVGQEYVFDRYWNPEGNPVRIRVLRKQTIRVPAGTFETIVLQPTIRTKGLFSEGGQAEVYVTNDERRLIVRLNARFSIATLRLELEQYRAGEPLTKD